MNGPRTQTEFLLDNFDMFIERLCYSYPFDINELRSYKDILKWDLISFNEKIHWDLEMMLEFSDYLDFGAGDREQDTKWINLNRAIPWSCDILEAFEERLQWRELCTMPQIYEDDDIRLRFYHRMEPYLHSDEDDETDQEDEVDDIQWMLNYIESFDEFPELCYHTEEEFLSAKQLNWARLSQNIYLPWSSQLLEKYADQWDWDLLSLNEALPWSEKLIERFADRWAWGGLEAPNDHGDRLVTWGITSNEAIYWTQSMLQKFCKHHDWFHLSYMKQVEWSINTLYEYQDYLEYEQVLFNDAIWQSVFAEGLDASLIDRIIRVNELSESLCAN